VWHFTRAVCVVHNISGIFIGAKGNNPACRYNTRTQLLDIVCHGIESSGIFPASDRRQVRLKNGIRYGVGGFWELDVLW